MTFVPAHEGVTGGFRYGEEIGFESKLKVLVFAELEVLKPYEFCWVWGNCEEYDRLLAIELEAGNMTEAEVLFWETVNGAALSRSFSSARLWISFLSLE